MNLLNKSIIKEQSAVCHLGATEVGVTDDDGSLTRLFDAEVLKLGLNPSTAFLLASLAVDACNSLLRCLIFDRFTHNIPHETLLRSEPVLHVPTEGGSRGWRRRGGGGGCSRASSLSPTTERRFGSRHDQRDPDHRSRDQNRDRTRTKLHKRHSHHGRAKSRGAVLGCSSAAVTPATPATTTQAAGAKDLRTLEVFGERAGGGGGSSGGEPTFEQEREGMHALEVTQYFFEAVSSQMERWYERKVEEARWQVGRRAQADREALVERIGCLEDELRLLRTSGRDEG